MGRKAKVKNPNVDNDNGYRIVGTAESTNKGKMTAKGKKAVDALNKAATTKKSNK